MKVVLIAVLFGIAAASAIAQPGNSMGCMGGGHNFTTGYGPGNTLMSKEEWVLFQQKMRGSSTYEECKSIQAENHQLMEERAKKLGKTLPSLHTNVCDCMKARGLFKQ